MELLGHVCTAAGHTINATKANTYHWGHGHAFMILCKEIQKGLMRP